jgi:hypothetical protein
MAALLASEAMEMGNATFRCQNQEFATWAICPVAGGRDLVLQLELVGEDDAVTLICSTLVGEELFRLTAQGADSAWEAHKRIARKLNANLPNLHLVLPDGQLLAKFCRINPGASVAEVTQRTSRTSNSHSR